MTEPATPDPEPVRTALAVAGFAALDAVNDPSPEARKYAQQQVAVANAKYEAALEEGLTKDQALGLR